MNPHVFFAPIPAHSEYPSWANYRAGVGRWNAFVLVGDKLESSGNKFAHCIAGQFLREMMPRRAVGYEGFTLSHPDLHVGDILSTRISTLRVSLTGALRRRGWLWSCSARRK